MSLLIVTQTALSLLRTDTSEKTKSIVGYEPFMSSIGVIANFDNSYIYDLNDKPVLTEGSQLFVPSGLCHADIFESNQSLLPYFNFIDFDKDLCKTNKFNELKWYILKSAHWDTVANWDDLEKIEITASQFPGALIVPEAYSLSTGTHILNIPNESVGYRIGFTYLPKTETGDPDTGQEIKVWDINYYFSQKAPALAGKSTKINEGEKSSKTTQFEQNVIFASQEKPVITQLFMQGELSVGSQLTAVYAVNPFSDRDHEIEMRFWWGNKNTTVEQAHFTNQAFLSTNLSPQLTEEQVGSVIEVTAMPIRIDSGLQIVGDIKTIDSLNSENILYQAPSVTGLMMSTTPLVQHSIGATYTFNNGGYPDSIDESTYRWHYQNSNGESITLKEGGIHNSGLVPAIDSIDLKLLGETLFLSVYPKDNFGRIGSIETISNNIIGIENIELNYQEVNFILGKAETIEVNATILYTNGDKALNPLGGSFDLNGTGFTINSNGDLTFDHNLRSKVEGILKYKYIDSEVQIPLTADFGEIGINSANIFREMIESQPFFIEYQFNNGWIPEANDLSTYELFIFEIDSFKSLERGNIKTKGKIETIYKLKASDREKEFKMEITPKDQFNREGPVKTLYFSPNPLG